jgi:CheY-like chemotaxis protein
MTGLLAGRRILVVEDEMLVLMNVEMSLSDLSCSDIFVAATVGQALALIREHDFDAVLLDVNLGGEKSYPVADVLAKQRIPFAFSTGCADHGDRTDLNCRPTLLKPYSHGDLETVFTLLLEDKLEILL